MQYISRLDRPLLRDRALATIRQAIVSGDLVPGEAIRDLDLAERLGLSRTPVREALSHLAEEGLVESKPHSYTRVTPIDPVAVRDALQVVQAMHGLALRLAVPLLTADHLSLMRAANSRFHAALTAGEIAGAFSADDDFHRVPVEACANFAVAATIQRYTPLVRRLEYQRFSSSCGADSVAMHEEIVLACEQGDGDLASRLAEHNWSTLAAELAKHPEGEPPKPAE
ncbi:GntR family transcriptional regulator [Kutzneria sp. CA-103260]|uniref:GntR family transcriptional regulator n=1 Tax=Kutzneria sp. CA-103260 TaxID=2802641 RepID=UPI001BA55C76|nr:GntR family transcriptional regulator [Kutzneria sp. CA-103260]QUQ72086.1 GntR family transcriptional regulator [Kutzneria sp. CA-103260]